MKLADIRIAAVTCIGLFSPGTLLAADCPAFTGAETNVMKQYHDSLAETCTQRRGEARHQNGQLICTMTTGSQITYYFAHDNQCRLQAKIRTSQSGERNDPMQGYLEKLISYSGSLKTATVAPAGTTH